MTTEKKAKAYDEALERFRAFKEKYYTKDTNLGDVIFDKTGEMQKDFKEIFPELRESKDESIRQKLMWLLQQDICPFPEEEVTQMLAYLEKQKKQNHEDEEHTDFTIYHPLKNGKGKYECIPYSFYGSLTSFSEDKDLIDFLRTCFYTKEECNKWIEQQKEQKPVQSDIEREYVRTLKSLISDFLRGKEEVDREYYQQIFNWLDGKHIEQKLADKEQDSITFLEQYGYTIVPPHAPVSIVPSSETTFTKWNEKDKEMLKRCIAVIPVQGDEIMPTSYLNKLRSWLKSFPERFNLQPKNEWSEEDEQNYKVLRSIVHGTYVVETQETMDKLLSWLKFLRPQPHWKPSEEQIGALNYAYCELFKREDVGHNILGPIQKLLDDLEKLM